MATVDSVGPPARSRTFGHRQILEDGFFSCA
jgi:hypothetical protein